MPLRICLFGDAQSVHIQQLASGLARHGQRVHVVTHKVCDVPGATVERFIVPRAGVRNLRRWHGRLTRYLRDFVRRFDVVNIHFLSDWGFTPEIMAEGCVVVSPWGSDVVPPPGEGEPPSELVARRGVMLRHAALVSTFGPSFAATLADYADLQVERIALLPTGVDLTRFQPGEPFRDERESGRRIGFFKGFREVYGAVDLIRAMPAVLEAHPASCLELVGDGPQLAECRRLAGELNVAGAVRWIARSPHHEIPGLLRRWDVSVIPSIYESFGVAALESSAMEVPVVASNVGGLPDTVVDGETGLLVPARSPEALADAIVGLLDDPARRRAMGTAGRQFVATRYDQNEMMRRWVDAYAEARTTAGRGTRAAGVARELPKERDSHACCAAG